MRKPISDIRLYVSRVPNEDGQPLPGEYGSRALSLHLRRIAMKLRELGFSLGSFDHLYINLTPCLPEGECRVARRSVQRELAWLRYVDAGVSEAALRGADDPACLAAARRCLQLFAQDEAAQAMLHAAFAEAGKGEGMLMRFREKQASGMRAVVFLRLLDSGDYHPLLCVYDTQGQERLRADLPPCMALDALGEIRLNRKAVTIKPRHNAFSADLQPMVFPLPDSKSAARA